MSRQTFMDQVLQGRIFDPSTAIDDFIDEWHELAPEKDLDEWLGFSPEEYALFVEKPELLSAVFAARRNNMALEDAIRLASSEVELAARGIPAAEAPGLIAWLRDSGRL